MGKVTDSSTEKKYYTQVCNLIDELDLSPLAIALYLHFKRMAFTGEIDKNGVKFLKEKYKVGAGKIRAAKDELVKNRLMKFKSFAARDAKPDEAEIVNIWERNHKYFQSFDAEPVPIQEQVGEPVPIQEQTRSQIGTDPFPDRNSPFPDRNALNKEEDIKDIKDVYAATNTGVFSSDVPCVIFTEVFNLTLPLHTQTLLAEERISAPELWRQILRDAKAGMTAAQLENSNYVNKQIQYALKDYRREAIKLNNGEKKNGQFKSASEKSNDTAIENHNFIEQFTLYAEQQKSDLYGKANGDYKRLN